MNSPKLSLTAVCLLLTFFAFSNDILLKGTVFENHNKGFRMVGVSVNIIDATTEKLIESLYTNQLGNFSVTIPSDRNYNVIFSRKNFLENAKEISTMGLTEKDELVLNIVMERKPGYIFDVTLAERKEKGDKKLDAVKGARIEVYNNTTRTSELELTNYPASTFQFVFESGNYYTVMIRKKGFFNKRIEAYIDIEGCILCFDGLDVKKEEVIGLTSHQNKRGAFLADIVLEPIEINRTYEVENIYYDFDKAYIRTDATKELDKLTTVLRDNQHILIELGSHTDARGTDSYNMKLSDLRAKSAVQYLTSKEGISADRMTWKGYGESQLINSCKNNVNCTEKEHQQNRRTELKIIGVLEDPLEKKSLKEIIEGGQKNLLLTHQGHQ